MNAIPNNVTRFVQAHLQSLQELRQPFDSVFALERCSGALKVIWETWTQDAIQRRLRDAQEGLNLFRSLAQDNGVPRWRPPSQIANNPPKKFNL